MAFAPATSVGLCNVPIDSTYKNQIRFNNADAQAMWFAVHEKFFFTEFLVVRKNKPGGGVQTSVKVGKNIDDLYGCNYIRYRNANHGDKWFYGFVTQLVYINENNTEVIFETDVWQTWMFDVEIKDSFVVREHCESDRLGVCEAHRVPEEFQASDYTYTYVDTLYPLSTWGYLVALSNPSSDIHESEMPVLHSGIYQGLYFYFFQETEMRELRVFLDNLDVDSVQFIAVIPRFCISNATIGPAGEFQNVSVYYVQGTDSPASDEFEYNFDLNTGLFEGYVPKNNKLYTNPYVNLVVSKHTGDAAIYNIEDFSVPNGAYGFSMFQIYGDISASPSIMVYPRHYKGLPHNIDSGFTIRDFAQCSTTNDAYKLWWAKNAASVHAREAASVAQMAFGGANIVGGLYAPPIVGDQMVAHGANQVVNGWVSHLNNWASVKAAQHEANRTTTGNPSTNLLSAIGWNRIALYKRSIRKSFAKCVDDFFTMYGYQTNKVKTPNIFSRQSFNYIETRGVNIIAKSSGVPNEDLTRIKRMFDDGVTFWDSSATVGDYSVSNNP